MSWTFEQVAGPFSFTEGPVWDGQQVLFCDVRADRIMAYRPDLYYCKVYLTDTFGAGGLARDRHGRLYACQGRARRVVRYEPDGQITVLATHYQGRRLNSPNDLVVDSRGRVWFSDPRYGAERASMELDHEAIYRIDPTSNNAFPLHLVADDLIRPNGLALSPDEQTLYVAESPRFVAETRAEGVPQLRAYPVLADGSLGSPSVLYDFGDQRGIDGLRVADSGAIVATCGWPRSGPGPRLIVFAPDGQVLAEHPTPHIPTNITFGGPQRADVFVTGFDGALWRAATELRGLPS
jgi:gluconolactonase